VIKSDSEGLPVSASTQPTMVSVMLSHLGLAAGHRVLETGTGTGYNAALIARIVGDQKSVVTTGTWDLATQWWARLGPAGRIVLSLSIRGIQLPVGLETAGDHLVSRSACRCSFIRMADAITGPESLLALGPQPGLHAQAVDGPAPDADALYEALSGPVTEEPTGLRAGDIGDITAGGYGPSGPGLAKYLARQAIVWHELGGPGAQDLELSAWPPGARPETIGGASIVIDRPHVRLAVRWPTL
jgi:protein-L-isoaspartate(D-aspartate) O-methyltransferase